MAAEKRSVLGVDAATVGTADAENLLYLARGADYTGQPIDINEAARVDWGPPCLAARSGGER